MKEQELERHPIVIFNLNELVDDMFLKHFSEYKIAQSCNIKLAERKKIDPSFNANEISTTQVKNYIKKRLIQNELESTPQELALLNRNVININERIKKQLDVLEDELNKMRSYEGPVLEIRGAFFKAICVELRELLTLAANVQGKLMPSISINILSQKTDKLCEVINSMPMLDAETKQSLTNATISQLLDNVSDLKTETMKEVKENGQS